MAGTSDSVSAQIVDGSTRILVLNAEGPRDARALLGTLNRPWEDRPSIIIVGADRLNIAEGLWEVVLRLDPRQVIVAGAPGDDPGWSSLERYCREHEVDLSYLESTTAFDTDYLSLTIHPPDENTTPSYLEVRRDGTLIGVGLGGEPAGERYHIVTSDVRSSEQVWSDLSITATKGNAREESRAIELAPGERVVIQISEDQLAVRGTSSRSLQ